MKVIDRTTGHINLWKKSTRLSCLMENITSSSDGEGLETDKEIEIPRQSFTRQSLFQGLKSRGFELEETHLREAERLEKLITLLAVSFCWAHKIGEWRANKKPIVFNRYKTSRRPQYSYFRYGIDFICQALANIACKGKQQLKKCIQQLWLPDYLLAKVCL